MRAGPVTISIALALVVAASAQAPIAWAQRDDAATALFARAEKAFEAGDKAAACPLYEQALARKDELPWKSAFLAATKLGLCHREAGKLASALASYRRAADIIRLNGDPKKDAKRVAAADKVAKDLAGRVPRLLIAIPPASRIPGLALSFDGRPLPAGEWLHDLELDGGRYVIRATAPDRAAFEEVVTLADQDDQKDVEIPVLAPAAADPPPPDVVPDVAPDAPAPPIRSRSRVPALVAAAIGGVALIAAGGFELSARSTYGAYEDDPTFPDHLLDSANRKRDFANYGAVIGGVSLAAAAALWFLWPERVVPAEDADLAIAPLAAPSTVGGVVTGRF
jgi:tetratricopeptide (TPR) repeat protein